MGLRTGSPADVPIAQFGGGTWAGMHASWADLEPARGQYAEAEWVRVEQWASALQASGKKVLLTMTGAPDWATGRTPGDTRALAPLPENVSAYGRLLGDLARRLGSSVDAWTTWNEPNLSLFMDPPSPSAYVAIQRAGYAAIKAARPHAVVLAGPFAGSGANQLQVVLARYLRLGLARSADALAWNTFQFGAPWRKSWGSQRSSGLTWAGDLQAASRLARRAKSSWRIWITEFGWSSCTSGKYAQFCSSPERQGGNLVSGYRILGRHAPEVRVALWYNARESAADTEWPGRLGLAASDGTPKPALLAFRGLTTAAQQGGMSRRPAVVRGTSVRRCRTTIEAEGFLRLQCAIRARQSGRLIISGRLLGSWHRIVTTKTASSTSIDARFVDKGYERLRVSQRPSR